MTWETEVIVGKDQDFPEAMVAVRMATKERVRYVPERTCEIVAQTWEDRGGDEEDTYKYELSCGHTVRMLDFEPLCNCPRCGRKVEHELD